MKRHNHVVSLFWYLQIDGQDSFASAWESKQLHFAVFTVLVIFFESGRSANSIRLELVAIGWIYESGRFSNIAFRVSSCLYRPCV